MIAGFKSTNYVSVLFPLSDQVEASAGRRASDLRCLQAEARPRTRGGDVMKFLFDQLVANSTRS